MRYRSHNNLIRYFIEDHDQLPDAYLRSCKKFFKELSDKQQATSCDILSQDKIDN